jgi:glycosyltransferase involved in cell wall biosynthesis
VSTVHVVVPDGIDDPCRPSGGNTYDRRVCDGLTTLGWSVHEHAVPGGWPRPEAASLTSLGEVLRGIPDGSVVLLDGLVASTARDVLVPEARRLRLIVLVHMPLGHRDQLRDTRARERAVLGAATAVITTSGWTRGRLIELYRLQAERIHIAEPGVDAADPAPGTASGGALLCVAAVTFDKGHDVLLNALQSVSDLPWVCVCVGSLERAPAFAADLRRRAVTAGLQARVRFAGVRTGAALANSYAAADVTVLASRAETYGMVITESLARALPVIATDVGGVREALGDGSGERRPGLLVAPDDPAALAGALRAWLGDAALRGRLHHAARTRRTSLRRWPATASVISDVLAAASR